MPTNALTRSETTIVKAIKTPVVITDPSTGKEVRTQGIWDTGATGSVITKSVAAALGLRAIGETSVTGVHGTKRVPVYAVRITLNNENISLVTAVTECDELSDTHDTGMLVGMNVISMGDFCITNFGGRTVMTFRVPSLETIDYVAEIAEHNRIDKIHAAQARRGINKCPCGSGKDWKNCHAKSKYYK